MSRCELAAGDASEEILGAVLSVATTSDGSAMMRAERAWFDGGGEDMADLTVHRFDYAMPAALAAFDVRDFLAGARAWVEQTVGPAEKVALSASGGVDSTTVAFLLKEVLGDRLYPFFIDDGVRRLIGGREEWEVTAEIFADFPNFSVIHTAELVIPWFEGIEDGTLKREMFRTLYTLTSNKHLAGLRADWIADGTIRPDIDMTDENRQIQHNVNLPYSMKKLEPFSALYKPHVRRVASALGMPRDFAMRIPCPGPAQLLRVGGAFSAAKLRVSKVATDVVESMVCEHLQRLWGEPFRYDEATGVRTPFQYFATCLDPEMEERPDLARCARGVLGGDAACFEMKTRAMWIDPTVGAQRSKLYAPILWVRGPAADHTTLAGLYDALSSETKLPRVLYEVADSGRAGYPAAIKIVESDDVRTARPFGLDFDALVTIGRAICEQAGASKVAFDISRRPPATIELF
jgi:GMP synthase PP-ATPase subunit